MEIFVAETWVGIAAGGEGGEEEGEVFGDPEETKFVNFVLLLDPSEFGLTGNSGRTVVDAEDFEEIPSIFP